MIDKGVGVGAIGIIILLTVAYLVLDPADCLDHTGCEEMYSSFRLIIIGLIIICVVLFSMIGRAIYVLNNEVKN